MAKFHQLRARSRMETCSLPILCVQEDDDSRPKASRVGAHSRIQLSVSPDTNAVSSVWRRRSNHFASGAQTQQIHRSDVARTEPTENAPRTKTWLIFHGMRLEVAMRMNHPSKASAAFIVLCLMAAALYQCSPPQALCSTSNCAGCCDATGQCQPTTPQRCGSQGAMCTACASGSGGGGGAVAVSLAVVLAAAVEVAFKAPAPKRQSWSTY